VALIACPVPGKAKSAMLCAAFIEGAPRNAEGFVFAGVKAGNHAQWLHARGMGVDWYYVDNAYMDATRATHFRVTKNRLQHGGRGQTNGKRFAATGVKIQPWVSRPDGYALVIQQSLDHYKHVLGLTGDWLAPTVKRLVDPIKVRFWEANKPQIADSFKEDLAGARLLVTHTSAAAVEAVLAGVPVYCEPECAAWDWAIGRNLIAWDQHNAGFDDRLNWAGVLCDQQWTVNEMKAGMAWRTLNPT
jgi:hypothetical protein